MMLALLLMLTPGTIIPCPPATAQTQADPTITPETRIVAGSVLKITVTDEPGLSGDFTVSAAGSVHFVISDAAGTDKVEWDVAVAGKTAADATGAVIAGLKTYLLAPEVKLVIAEMPRLRIEVSGPVRRNTLRLPLGSHLSDALSAAKCDADTDFEKILLLRKDKMGGKMLTKFISLADAQGETDPTLESGDRIVLQKRPAPRPESQLRTVRVTGQVGVEGDVPVGPKETMKELLAGVGGLKENADRKRILLHRATTDKDYTLDADLIAAGDPLHNIQVEPGDFIVVSKVDLSLRYAVGGEVMQGSIFPFDPAEHMTVSRALEKAGGVNKKGDSRHGVLRRGFFVDPVHTHDLVFDLDAIHKKKARDWDLIPGDLIIIPQKQHRPSLLQALIPIALHFLPFGL
jgi:protein involved in polysaccharide export with SLBB domain